MGFCRKRIHFFSPTEGMGVSLSMVLCFVHSEFCLSERFSSFNGRKLYLSSTAPAAFPSRRRGWSGPMAVRSDVGLSRLNMTSFI